MPFGCARNASHRYRTPNTGTSFLGKNTTPYKIQFYLKEEFYAMNFKRKIAALLAFVMAFSTLAAFSVSADVAAPHNFVPFNDVPATRTYTWTEVTPFVAGTPHDATPMGFWTSTPGAAPVTAPPSVGDLANVAPTAIDEATRIAPPANTGNFNVYTETDPGVEWTYVTWAWSQEFTTGGTNDTPATGYWTGITAPVAPSAEYTWVPEATPVAPSPLGTATDPVDAPSGVTDGDYIEIDGIWEAPAFDYQAVADAWIANHGTAGTARNLGGVAAGTTAVTLASLIDSELPAGVTVDGGVITSATVAGNNSPEPAGTVLTAEEIDNVRELAAGTWTLEVVFDINPTVTAFVTFTVAAAPVVIDPPVANHLPVNQARNNPRPFAFGPITSLETFWNFHDRYAAPLQVSNLTNANRAPEVVIPSSQVANVGHISLTLTGWGGTPWAPMFGQNAAGVA
ncbi:MAG: hypothetical protein FWC67_02175, partial [Defluviitaleaceae bacterium]|nr:hypothetical protein [Defluviitaleaceae bacterium]